jgi:centromere protein I
LDKHIFQPFETAVLSHNPGCHLELLVLYTNLLQHWTAILYSSDEVPDYANSAIEAVIRHVEPLAQTLIQISRTESTEATILAFYEQTVRLVTDATLQQHVKIALPPSSLVYFLFFSSSLATVSRLCYVLANYKKGFEAAMSVRRQDPQQKGGAVKYNKAQVILYNSYLMDICNCLWRARAFHIEEGKSKGCMISETTVAALTSYVSSVAHGSSLASLFDLSHSPVLSLQSIQQVRELEDEEIEAGTIESRHAGPVTQSSLTRLASSGGLALSWQNYRIGVLKALSEKGLVGVAELLKNTMTVLKNAMEDQEGSK